MLAFSKKFNTHQMGFSQLAHTEQYEIENRNISAVGALNQYENIRFGCPYCEPIRIFDIHAFNARIMKLLVVPTNISVDGESLEDILRTPKVLGIITQHLNN